MKWSDVDFDRGEIVVETTRNGDPKIVPLPSEAVVGTHLATGDLAGRSLECMNQVHELLELAGSLE